MRVILDTLHLAGNKGKDFLFHTLIVGFDSLTEIIGAIFFCELRDDRNGLIRLHLRGNLGGIHHNLCVEDFLLNALVEVVGDGSDKHALCEVGDFGSRDKAIELGGDGGRLVVAVDGHRLSLLKDFSEAFGEGLGSLAYYLTAKDISHGVLNNLAFFVAVVTRELREVLEAQTNCHIVTSGSGNEVVQATKVDGR